jgi:sensor histidine kinase YesM
MKFKWAAAAVTLAILAATYGLFLVGFSQGGKHTPKAENGFLDLTAWPFADNGAVPLDGEWEFYPDQLLDAEHFALASAKGGAPPPERIEVPGSWSGRMPTLGMATYRLQVKVGDPTAVYGLKTASIQMSNRILVNGQVVGQSGIPAERQHDVAVNRPYASFFTLKPGWNEIIVQTANHEFPASSGVVESIYLGPSAQISGLRDKALTHDWIAVTAFLIMGLYFIGLYSQRKHDVSLLVLGMVCVCFALFTSTRGERVLFAVFGYIPFWLYLRVQMISAIGGGLGLILYVYTAFRPFCSRGLIRFGVAAGAALAIWALFLIPRYATDWYRQLVTVYATLSPLYAVYVFVLAAFRKVEGSLYLTVAAVALNVYVLMQNVNVYFAVPVDSLPPFEPFVLLLMLALLMSLRFSNAFKKIEELSVQLLRSDKLKDEFLARTSHEFKSPMHGIMHISRSLLEDTRHPPTAEQREKLHLVMSITGRLSQLVYDILDFSKLKQGELAIDPAPVDVRSAVETQVRIYSFLCEDRNTRLMNLVPDGLPFALADESRLSQIIGNLLDNAVKATKNGSIVVAAAEKDGMIEISVSDTGEGMDAQNIPHIFEAFQTFDETKENRGFGLGLPIVKQLVELQHGNISVSSVKGVGTTFTFTLPIASGGEIGGRAQTASGRAELPVKTPEYVLKTPYYLNQKGKHTILIVDDQFLNLKVLMDALQPLGYNVIAVQNGFEAMEQIGGPNKIDLVVLDLMMPGLSGYEVCQEIRKTYTLPELPVLMVTAAIGPQDKVAAFEAGANDFLPKPFDLAELKARIGGLLALKDSLAKAVDLEVAFLQSQIKPHFLYNVLNSIVASSYTDVERSRKLTADLADYLRGSFRFSHTEKRISFEEEFGLIRTYVEIEKARFKDRLRFEYDIAEGMFLVNLPPLLIQPLVENAIRHGISHRIGGGKVKLTAYQAEGEYRFVIEDDGVGFDSELALHQPEAKPGRRQGVGLLNINKRLKYEYGTGLQMESAPGQGTKVTVRIPAEPA